MTGTVLDIVDMHFVDDEHLVVQAVIEEAVLVRRQTQLEPEQYGPALCEGTLFFTENTLIPATDQEFISMLSNEVDDWEIVENIDDN